jgi:Protein of unknown function (DUF2845)
MMPMNPKTAVAAISSLFFLSTSFPAPAIAEDTTFRCGGETVSIGDSTYNVQKACGKPARTEKTGTAEKTKKEKAAPGQKTSKGKSTRVEKWYYDEGYGGFVYALTFQGGTLKKIEKSGRGK